MRLLNGLPNRSTMQYKVFRFLVFHIKTDELACKLKIKGKGLVKKACITF